MFLQRVPCNADIASELQLAREDASARALAANLWLTQQAELAAALASDEAAAVSMPVVPAPTSAAIAFVEAAAASMPVVAAPTWYLHPQPGTQPRYKCPACSRTFSGTSGIHNHWPNFHAGDALPLFTQESTRVFVPIMRA